MPDLLITDPNALTPARLTELLRAAGHLAAGEVTSVHLASSAERLVSNTFFLEVAYSESAAPPLPGRLFFKVTKPHLVMRGKEVSFYHRVAGRKAHLPVPRAFSAVFCPESKREHVLLEDLSPTHHGGSVWPTLPDAEQMVQLVDALAELHTVWWEEPSLLEDLGHSLEWEAVAALFAEDNDSLARMLRSLADSLPHAQADLFRRVYQRFPRVYWERRYPRRHLTLVHGDAHAWNALYPAAPGGRVHLIDWQCWDLCLGARDMAYLVGLRWTQELRRRHERDLLHRYHDRLLAGGVTGYTWEDCWQDYRLMCLYNCYLPACFYHKRFGEAGMWRMIEESVGTAADLECLELLG